MAMTHRLLACLAVLAVASCGSPGGATGRPSPSPSLAASTTPSSTALAPRAVVFDWVHARVVDVEAGTHGIQSPDGSRIWIGGESRIVTATGELVGTVPNRKIGWRWADDSRHLCAAYFDSPAPPADNSARTPTGLYETLPGSAPALIAQVGYLVAQSGPFVLGCSFGHGTATVGESCVNSLCETWTVDLLSHRILSHLTNIAAVDPTSSLEGVLSPDGTLLAVSGSRAVGSTIYRTASGTVVTTLSGSKIVAFTADDKAVLVVHASGSAQLLDLSGGVIATLPGAEVESALAEPGGSRLAVALGSPGATSTGYPGPADIVVVGVDGQVAPIAQGVLPQF